MTYSIRFLKSFGLFAFLLFGVAVGLLFVFSDGSQKNSFAQQAAAPVDITNSATFSPIPQGFQVSFPNPVSLTSIAYNGPYQGPYEVVEAPTNTGGMNEALSLIDKALDIKPDDPTLLDTKGLIYLKNNRPLEAIPHLERAVELTCEGPIYVLHLAYAQLKAGDSDKAEVTINKVRANLTPKIDQLSDDNKQMLNELEMKLGGLGS